MHARITQHSQRGWSESGLALRGNKRFAKTSLQLCVSQLGRNGNSRRRYGRMMSNDDDHNDDHIQRRWDVDRQTT